jgi:hypothetical protein
MPGLDDDTLIQLLQMTAESMEVDPEGVEITDELEDEVEAYEAALQDALELVAKGFPPSSDVTAEDLWDAEASYLVLMTLRGEGVGIWDGSWDEFFDEREIEDVERLLKSKLRSFADESGGGSLNEALMNAVDDTAGDAGDEDEDEEPEEDEGEEDDEEYESNKKLPLRRNAIDHKTTPPEGFEVFRDPSDGWRFRSIDDRDFQSLGYTTRKAASLAAWRHVQRHREPREYESNKKLPLRRNAPTELALNARRAKYIYRVRGTAGAYADRDRDFRHGRHTVYMDVSSEDEAREAAENFMQSERPQGREARVWIEETTPRTGEFSQVAKWIDGGRGEWKLDYDRKPTA